jgi:hypothetical protein
MPDDSDPPPIKHKLGKRAFDALNEPRGQAGADPNAVSQSLAENLAKDPSLELPGIDEEVYAYARKKRNRAFAILLALAAFDLLCYWIAKRTGWNPFVAVPVVSAGAMVTAATLWVCFVVMR